MRTLISYDVDGAQTEVMTAALALGFQDCFLTERGWERLPETTLVYDSDNTTFTRNRFFEAVVDAELDAGFAIKVEKYIVVAFDPPVRMESDTKCKAAKSR